MWIALEDVMMRDKSKRGKTQSQNKPQQQKRFGRHPYITFHVAASKGGLTVTKQRNVLMHQAISFV